MDRVERALEIEQAKTSQRTEQLKIDARRELPTLVKELRSLRREVAQLWIEVCEAEGLSPADLNQRERLITSEENAVLATRYARTSQIFKIKLKQYCIYCNALGLPRNLIERGSQNERRKSNVGESEERSTAPRLRQSRSDRSGRISRVSKKRINRRK